MGDAVPIYRFMPAMKRPLTFAAACLAASWPAAAAPREIGGWTIAAAKDGKGCFLTRTYDRRGNTTLLFGLDRGGANRLTVLNANWSIESEERLKLDFRLSNGGYAKHFAIGMAADGKQGFVTSFEGRFPGYFAASDFLHIARGDVAVERLPLDGSGAAVAELRACVAAQRPEPAAAKDRKHSDDIPRDPFARGLRSKR